MACPRCKGTRYTLAIKYVPGYGHETVAVRCDCKTPQEIDHKKAASGDRE